MILGRSAGDLRDKDRVCSVVDRVGRRGDRVDGLIKPARCGLAGRLVKLDPDSRTPEEEACAERRTAASERIIDEPLATVTDQAADPIGRLRVPLRRRAGALREPLGALPFAGPRSRRRVMEPPQRGSPQVREATSGQRRGPCRRVILRRRSVSLQRGVALVRLQVAVPETMLRLLERSPRARRPWRHRVPGEDP